MMTAIKERVQIGDITLLRGDCLEVIPELIKEGVVVDCVLTDPPYGMINAEWDKAFFEWIPLCKEILKNSGYLCSFSSPPFNFALNSEIQKNGFDFRTEFIWVKNNGSPILSRCLPRKSHENFYVYKKSCCEISDLYFNGYEGGEKGKPYLRKAGDGKGITKECYGNGIQDSDTENLDGQRWIKTTINAVGKNSMPVHERTKHPTQKPTCFIEKILYSHTKQNDVILEPFLGSGTTAIASQNTGRKCIAIELDPEYFKIAVNRVRENARQGRLDL